jgi:hypothetical protein
MLITIKYDYILHSSGQKIRNKVAVSTISPPKEVIKLETSLKTSIF